jgi:hypothetical protein
MRECVRLELETSGGSLWIRQEGVCSTRAPTRRLNNNTAASRRAGRRRIGKLLFTSRRSMPVRLKRPHSCRWRHLSTASKNEHNIN